MGRGGGFTFTTVYDRVEGSATRAPVGTGVGGWRCESDAGARGGTRDGDDGPVVAATDDADPVDAHADAVHCRRTVARPASWRNASSSRTRRPRGSACCRRRGRAEALLSGKVVFDTLTIDPEVAVVEFYLDGERVRAPRLAAVPGQARPRLDPPREQVVRVVALRAPTIACWARTRWWSIASIRRSRSASRRSKRTTSGALEVTADLRSRAVAELERVAFFLGDRALGEMTRPPFVARVEAADVDPEAFVRVVATLRDGRERENVALLDEKVFVEHVDVRMVELQLVVTDRTGTAVGGLGVEDFEVVEGKKTHPARAALSGGARRPAARPRDRLVGQHVAAVGPDARGGDATSSITRCRSAIARSWSTSTRSCA